MAKIPGLSGEELVKALKKAGFRLVRHGLAGGPDEDKIPAALDAAYEVIAQKAKG